MHLANGTHSVWVLYASRTLPATVPVASYLHARRLRHIWTSLMHRYENRPVWTVDFSKPAFKVCTP